MRQSIKDHWCSIKHIIDAVSNMDKTNYVKITPLTLNWRGNVGCRNLHCTIMNTYNLSVQRHKTSQYFCWSHWVMKRHYYLKKMKKSIKPPKQVFFTKNFISRMPLVVRQFRFVEYIPQISFACVFKKLSEIKIRS